MLNRTVPTPVKVVPTEKSLALILNTSRSGSWNWTAAFHVQPSESTQLAPRRLTMMPVGGAAAWAALSPGPGMPLPGEPGPALQVVTKLFGTVGSATGVVWLPEWNAAT